MAANARTIEKWQPAPFAGWYQTSRTLARSVTSLINLSSPKASPSWRPRAWALASFASARSKLKLPAFQFAGSSYPIETDLDRIRSSLVLASLGSKPGALDWNRRWRRLHPFASA